MHKWIKRYEEDGIDGLTNHKPTGMPRGWHALPLISDHRVFKETAACNIETQRWEQLRADLPKGVVVLTISMDQVIICYTEADEAKVARVLKELELQDKKYVVVIDVRSGNKPSASKA